MKIIICIILSMLAELPTAQARSPFKNLESLKRDLGFASYYSLQNSGRRVRIAILDKGFQGYEKEVGSTLPVNTRFIAGPVPNPPEMNTVHGLKMAQILTAMMTNEMKSPQWMPELSLYNVFGYSNFKAAIDDVIQKKIDLVLYSEVWEYGGNHTGDGFINAQVHRATKAGILWVNAAGNFAQTTYNSPLITGRDNWIQLPNQNNSLAIRCEVQQGSKCPVKIVLSWNDFKNNIEEGTNKDLDLALTDDLLNILQSSSLKQSNDRNEERPGYSKYPREIISTELAPGLYFLRVKNRSNNFSQNNQLRITVDGAGIIMPSHSKFETLLNPADNPTVITVGAHDSERSSISAQNNKPDLFAPSSIILEDGSEYRGSSNAAAIVAAGLGILKSRNSRLGRMEVMQAVTTRLNWNQAGLSLRLLGFGPTAPNCFVDVQYKPLPSLIYDAVSKGGVAVKTTEGIRIMFPTDPLWLAPHLHRNFQNDMIVALAQGGYAVFPRNSRIPSGSVEIFQRPIEMGLCRPEPIKSKIFHL